MIKDVLYGWNGGNNHLFHLINDLHTPLSDRFMLLGTQLGNYVLFPAYLTLFAVIGFLVTTRSKGMDSQQKQQMALNWLNVLGILCMTAVLDGILVTVIKHWFAFPRPLMALPPATVHLVGKIDANNLSFPSGHSSFAMVLALSLWPIFKHWQRGVALLFVLWVGVSRVNVGAHFPADVLAGWLLVVPCLLLARMMVAQWLSRRLAHWLSVQTWLV
ncbi:MAG: phosphatase PAP2 family protein [Magnetococcus sp. YQC-5]